MEKTQPIIVLSADAIQQVREIALHAAETDDWMTPVVDEHIGRKDQMEATRDYGQFVGYHRDSWGSTDHFSLLYRESIGQIALEEALPYGVGRDLSEDGKFWVGGFNDWEAYHYDIFEPLLDEFWETWENAQNLYDLWDRAAKNWHTDTYNLFTGGHEA
jgi:hypothetical protein